MERRSFSHPNWAFAGRPRCTAYLTADRRALHGCVRFLIFAGAVVIASIFSCRDGAEAATLTVELIRGDAVTFLGAIRRWDADGNHRRLPDRAAKIDAPTVDAEAVSLGNRRWEFRAMPPGKYDLVILAKNCLRIEGFQYVPVKEFDPFLAPDASVASDVREFIVESIRGSRHFENRVEPLYFSGDEKAVRVLMMLIRDQPTSYEKDFPGAATIRHEIWQYSWQHGGWQKEKRTKVLDRVMLPRDELSRWTWLWDPQLGGIDVKDQPLTLTYELPDAGQRRLQGLSPGKP